MRLSIVTAAILMAGTASLAHAQSYYSSTLDQQYERVAPQPASPPSPPVAGQEWPASPSNAIRPGEAIGSVGSGAIPALPLQAMTNGNITYLNGGIGDEELAQLKAQGDQYNLHLLLSATNGNYISNVTLEILDRGGHEVAVINDAGPYVYAKLPAGKYTLKTTYQSAAKSVTVNVPARGSVKSHVTYVGNE